MRLAPVLVLALGGCNLILGVGEVSSTGGGGADAGVDGDTRAAVLVIDPTTFDFGDVVLGAAPGSHTFTITNTGTLASGTIEAQLGGGDASSFMIDNACTTLAPSETCHVSVSFAPGGTGVKDATLSITGGATSSLSGTALAPGALAITPDTKSFGNIVVFGSSAAQTLTVENTGGSSSGALSVSLGGTDAGQFVLEPHASGDCDGATLAAHATCAVRLHFTPNDPGAKSASLTVSSTSAGSTTAQLDGGGIDGITVTASADFGSIGTGLSSGVIAFTVSNSNATPTGALTFSLAGADASQFALLAPTGSDCVAGTTTLALGATCTIRAKFAPDSTGAKTAGLNVSASPGGTASGALTGTGVTPPLLAATGVLGFGGQTINTTSVPMACTISNGGQAATGPLGFSISGADASQFTIVSPGAGDCTSGAKLAGGASCTVRVAFAPTTSGAKQAKLDASAAPGGSGSCTLTGTGYTPGAIAFDQASYDFGTIDVGQVSTTATFKLTNTGGSTTGSISTSFTGDTASYTIVSDACKNATLAPAGTCLVKVQLAPKTYGPLALSLVATANPGGSATVSMGGTGRDKHTLTVSIMGDGPGTISATGLTCSGATCTGTYTRTGPAPSVTITATPGTAVTIDWTGACTGSSTQCTVVMDVDRNATITFTQIKNTLTVANTFLGTASGKITSSPSGINCGTVCAQTFSAAQPVTLTATPLGSSVFQGWKGDCSGNSATCVVSMSAARNVTAVFKPPVNTMFVTSQRYAVTQIGGLAGADDICQSSAAAAGLPGHFVAFLSTSSVDAKSRVGNARGWIRTDGKPVIDQLSTTLTTGQLFYAPEYDENGQLTSTSVITGSNSDGTKSSGETCSDYTSTSGYAAFGAPSYGAFNWLLLGVTDCTSTFSLACMQTDYTNAVSPPPLGSPLAFLTKGFFDTATGLAAADALCKSEATAAGLQYPDLYKALLGTSTMAPASRFNSTYVWRRADDVALNVAGDNLFDKAKRWIAPIDVGADKTYLGGYNLALGSLDPNTIGANTCNDWTTNASTAKMDMIQNFSPAAFQYAYTYQCTQYAKLICLYSNQ
ncbi:MAG TPA: choice-of-anchor D domain-containing protein [Kofleriaceae bacterium]|nr:choice-of-anchor D domain-containing protein [Kofleriaceae bacterium]